MDKPFSEIVIGEFDSARKTLHLTARERALAQTQQELNELCESIRTIIKQYCRDERIYMVVDLSKIIIEPQLSEEYAKKVKSLYEDFLVPGGLLRYGLQITRITIKLGHDTNLNSDTSFFRSKEAAFAHIDKLIAQKTTPAKI